MNKIDSSEISEPISIFWTGGWDSSYRIVELSRQGVEIRPIYILDPKRESNRRELEAIEIITGMLEERCETTSKFLPLSIVNVDDIAPDESITEAAKSLGEEFGLGVQHDWTARVAKEYPGVEMCIEKAVKGYMPIREMIRKYGTLEMGSHGYSLGAGAPNISA